MEILPSCFYCFAVTAEFPFFVAANVFVCCYIIVYRIVLLAGARKRTRVSVRLST